MRDVYYNVYTYVFVCTVQSVLTCMCIGTINYYYTCLQNKNPCGAFYMYLLYFITLYIYTHTAYILSYSCRIYKHYKPKR